MDETDRGALMPAKPRKPTVNRAAQKSATLKKPSMKGMMPKANVEVIARLDAIAAGLPAYRKPMFGTVAWFLEANAQMFMGAWGDDANVRVGADEAARLIASGDARSFEPMLGRPMREYVLVPASALADTDLRKWMQRAATFAGELAAKKGK